MENVGKWRGNLKRLPKRLLSVPHESYFQGKGGSLLKIYCKGFPSKIDGWEPLLLESNGMSSKCDERDVEEVTSLGGHSCRSQCYCCCNVCIKFSVLCRSSNASSPVEPMISITPQILAEEEELMNDCSSPMLGGFVAAYGEEIVGLNSLPTRRPFP